MATSDDGEAGSFGPDDATVVEDWEEKTPETMPRCTVCGRVIFYDEFSQAGSIVAQGLFHEERCVRARDGHWRWCCETREFVYKVPR